MLTRISDKFSFEESASQLSAIVFLDIRQKIFFLIIISFFLIFAVCNPSLFVLSVLLFTHALYFLLMFGKIVCFFAGSMIPSKCDLAEIVYGELPRYTIMVPLFKEEKVINQLVTSLSNLKYDKNKLQILIIVEEGDDTTITNLNNIILPKYFEIITVPHSLPQTKPKALNYAFQYVKGEYVTIYDAEDEPDIYQLYYALNALNNNENFCVQAQLKYYNSSDNVLTQFFQIEYSAWFMYVLPALAKYNFPITLGGTSNHFKTEKLRNIGCWDQYNVTEDADLGIRIGRQKGKIAIINNTTFEESPISVPAWINQRRRWIKGFFQTFFVHTRHPRKLFKELGLINFIAFIFLVGVPNFLLFLAPWLLLFHAAAYFEIVCISEPFSSLINYISLLNVIFNILSCQLRAFWIKKEDPSISFLAAVLSPIYYMLHIIAAFLALKDITEDLHYWHKTYHGACTRNKDSHEKVSNTEAQSLVSKDSVKGNLNKKKKYKIK